MKSQILSANPLVAIYDDVLLPPQIADLASGNQLPNDIASAPADSDQDGMPDSWEYLYFGDVVAAAPDGDEDGDGRSNLDEFTADTDPTNHGSMLELERIDRGSGGEMMIYVPDSSPQRLYTLLESTDLGGADPWEAAGPTIIGNDSTLVFPHSGGGVRRFYRVQARIP